MGTQSIVGRVVAGCIGALLLAALVAPSTPVGAAGPPTVSITPPSGLTDLDTVTISGTGFTPNTPVGACEGVPGGTTLDSCGLVFGSTTSGPTGDFSFLVEVRQVIRVPALGRTVDCRVETCVVAAAELDGLTPIPASIVTTPILFAPAPTPPVTKGSISVTPDADLIAGQELHVAGSGFRPNVLVEVLLCGSSTPVDQGDCLLPARATTDATGGFEVQAGLSTTSIQPAGDCTVAPGTCTLVVGEAADVAGTLVSDPLSFRTAGGFQGLLQVFRDTDLLDREQVGIMGQQFDPGTMIAVCQHTYPFDATDTCGSNVAIATSDQFGTFELGYTVRRRITEDDVVHDCLTERCVIVAAEAFVTPRSIAQTAISFAPPPPTVVPGVTAVPPAEGDSGTTTVEVPVHLSAPSTNTVTVPWSTIFVPGAPAGQADPATDYVAASGVATFPAGQIDTTVTIVVNGDTLVEPDEYIVVSFNHPENAVMGGFWGLGFGIIGNDDP